MSVRDFTNVNLKRLTHEALPYCERTIDFDADESHLNADGVIESEAQEAGKTLDQVIGNSEYKVDNVNGNTVLYNKMYVGKMGNLAMYDQAWVWSDANNNSTVDEDESRFVTRYAQQLDGQVLDPSMLRVAFNNAEFNNFIENLIPIYKPEIKALNDALKADGVRKAMSPDLTKAVVAEARTEHPDLGMILHAMYDVDKLSADVRENLEWTVLHYDYLWESLKLVNMQDEIKDANGEPFALDATTHAAVIDALFPTEPVFEGAAALGDDYKEAEIHGEMTLDADPAGAETYIRELAGVIIAPDANDTDFWNDPARVRNYFNSIVRALGAAGGEDALPEDIRGRDHVIEEFTRGQSGRGQFLSDQLNSENNPHRNVRIDTGDGKVPATFIMDGNRPAGNEDRNSNIRRIAAYLEGLAVDNGIEFITRGDYANMRDNPHEVVAEADADAVALPEPAAAAPSYAVITITDDGNFTDDVTSAGKKDSTGNVIGDIYVKVTKAEGTITRLDIFAADGTTAVIAEGKTTQLSFTSPKEYREYFSLPATHTIQYEREVALLHFNNIFANTNVDFENGKSTITDAGTSELDKLVNFLKINQDSLKDTNITINTRGYASFDMKNGVARPWSGNGTLANARAKAVSEYLKGQLSAVFGQNMQFVPYVIPQDQISRYRDKTSEIYYQGDPSKRRTSISATTPDMASAGAGAAAPAAIVAAPEASQYVKEINTSSTVMPDAIIVTFNVPGITAAHIASYSILGSSGNEVSASSIIRTGTPMSGSEGNGTTVETEFTGPTLWSGRNANKKEAPMTVILTMNDRTKVRVNVVFKKATIE